MALDKISIGDLPAEVLLMIMRSLTTKDVIRCSMVCHHWRRLAFDETLWKSGEITPYTVIPLRRVAELVQRGLQKISLRYTVICDPDTWTRVFSPPTYKSQMRFLDLTKAGVSEKALECLLKHMNELRELHLEECNLNHICCKLISRNTQLQTLNLSECRLVLNPSGLELILKNCQRLENLNLSKTSLTRRNWDRIATKIPPSIRRLNLKHCGSVFLDKHLEKIIETCPNITHLNISGNSFLSYAAVEATASLNNLEELLNEQSYDSFDSDDSDDSYDPDDNDDDLIFGSDEDSDEDSDVTSSDDTDKSSSEYSSNDDSSSDDSDVPFNIVQWYQADYNSSSSSSDSSFVLNSDDSDDDV